MGTGLAETREFEKSFLDRAIVIDMNSIFEDVIHKVRVRLDEIIELLKGFELFSLLVME